MQPQYDMIRDADHPDVLQSGDTHPLPQAILSPARHAAIEAHSACATTCGRNECVATPRRLDQKWVLGHARGVT